MYFDETYYIKGAKTYLSFIPDTNWTHPPLGKIMISAGIFFFGDNTLGWRITGILLGSLMIILMYFLAQRLFKSRFAGISAAILTAICPLNIVQSRIATLDIFLTFFTLLGFYFLYLYIDTETGKTKKEKTMLVLCVISFGLSCACKWSGIFAIAGALIILFYYKFFSREKRTRAPGSFISILALFFIITSAVYLASYIPFFLQKQSFNQFILNHVKSVTFHYESSFAHNYLTPVWTWPLMIRPMWFYFQQIPHDKYQGIISMGNPFIWWSFLIFFIFIIIDFIKTRKDTLFFIIAGYLSLYLPWFISTKGGFFYYLEPATIFMYLGITCILTRWWETKNKNLVILYFIAAFVFFITFLPVIIAVPVNKAFFYKLMWFKSWI
ncbi:MAG: phospholipid carrier-dependent glycosyltransferase [Armatimonadota bacterium]